MITKVSDIRRQFAKQTHTINCNNNSNNIAIISAVYDG